MIRDKNHSEDILFFANELRVITNGLSGRHFFFKFRSLHLRIDLGRRRSDPFYRFLLINDMQIGKRYAEREEGETDTKLSRRQTDYRARQRIIKPLREA